MNVIQVTNDLTRVGYTYNHAAILDTARVCNTCASSSVQPKDLKIAYGFRMPTAIYVYGIFQEEYNQIGTHEFHCNCDHDDTPTARNTPIWLNIL